MRRHKLLTESQASAFDLGVVEERAAREAAWKAEQERYACLPEGPISERQYREIIRRNAYIWASARYENGRLVLVSEQERDARLKHLRGYQAFWHRTSETGKLIDPPEVEDVDLTTNLSYGVINLATGLVAWRKEPKNYDSLTYLGDETMIKARNRRLGEYYRNFEPPFP